MLYKKFFSLYKITSFLILFSLFFYYALQKVNADIPSNGLTAYFSFEEGSGTISADITGNSNTLTLGNIPSWISSSYSGKGVTLQGTTQYLQTTSLDTTNFPQSGTLSFWIKADFSQNNLTSLFDNYDDSRGHIFIRTLDSASCGADAGLQIAFQDTLGYSFARGLCNLESNKWINLVVSWDTVNDKGYIYVNGALVHSAPITNAAWIPSGQNFLFGSPSNPSFAGSFDDIRVYNRVLSSSEMFDLYTLGNNGTAASETWYARPVGTCPYNGNGLSYDCASGPGGNGAFMGNSSISWAPVSGVDEGDILYICGEHRNDGLFVPEGANGTADKRISVTFDCPSDPGSVRMISNMGYATDTASWVNESPNLWYLHLTSYGDNTPKRLFVDDLEKVPAQGKANIGASYNGGPVSSWWYATTTSDIYYYSLANPATTFSKMESLVQTVYGCPGSAICLNDKTVRYVDIINPKVYGGGQFTINTRGSDYNRIYGTTGDDSSCIISLNKTLVIIQDDTDTGTGDPSEYNEVYNCTVNTDFPSSFSGLASEVLGGDGISVRRSSNNRIYSNTIKNTGHAGIYFTSSYSSFSTTPTNNNIAEDNTLILDNNLHIYGRAIASDGTASSSASHNIFRRNYIDGWTVRSQINGEGTVVVNNIFKNQRADNVYNPPRSDMLSMQGYSSSSESHLIANNVFYNDPYGPCIDFIDGGSQKKNITIANNVMLECYDLLFSTHAALTIPIGSTISDNFYKNNRIYNSDTTYLAVSYKGYHYSVDEFNATSTSGDTVIGNTGGDPDLKVDFSLKPLSNLIDTGVDVGLSADYLGNPIYGTPDIGAYEYQPPYTMGVDKINIASGARIYGDGKFRDVNSTSTSFADMSITPASGSFSIYDATSTRPEWLNVSISKWNTTGDYSKTWTESSLTLGTASTSHIIGDLKLNTWYIVKRDGVEYGTTTSNSSGKISFIYEGGYSTHTFDVIENPTQPSTPVVTPTPPVTPTQPVTTFSSGGGSGWYTSFYPTAPVIPSVSQNIATSTSYSQKVIPVVASNQVQNQSTKPSPVVNIIKNTVSPTETCLYYFSKNLVYHDDNEDVRELQKFLNSDTRTIVRKTGNGSPGKEITYYGISTYFAVMKYQLLHLKEMKARAPSGAFLEKTRKVANRGCVDVY